GASASDHCCEQYCRAAPSEPVPQPPAQAARDGGEGESAQDGEAEHPRDPEAARDTDTADGRHETAEHALGCRQPSEARRLDIRAERQEATCPSPQEP